MAIVALRSARIGYFQASGAASEAQFKGQNVHLLLPESGCRRSQFSHKAPDTEAVSKEDFRAVAVFPCVLLELLAINSINTAYDREHNIHAAGFVRPI